MYTILADIRNLMPDSIDAGTVLFVLVAGVAALAAIGVVAFGSAVRSALCLVINFLSLAVLYFMLNVEMLGIVQVVVYTGAIMVLFLFVIMLLNLGAPNALRESRDLKRLFAGIFALALFAIVFSQVVLPLGTREPSMVRAAYHAPGHAAFGTPEHMGRLLLTDYVWPFEMASVLLLVGIVGSVLLVRRRSK